MMHSKAYKSYLEPTKRFLRPTFTETFNACSFCYINLISIVTDDTLIGAGTKD